MKYRINPIAKILRTPLFKKRVVRSRVKYNRKLKHKENQYEYSRKSGKTSKDTS